MQYIDFENAPCVMSTIFLPLPETKNSEEKSYIPPSQNAMFFMRLKNKFKIFFKIMCTSVY